MGNRILDIKNCETCNHCMVEHIKRAGKYSRGMLYYCKPRNRLVDKDDKCRKWQQFELPQHVEEKEKMDALLAQLKEQYNY